MGNPHVGRLYSCLWLNLSILLRIVLCDLRIRDKFYNITDLAVQDAAELVNRMQGDIPVLVKAIQNTFRNPVIIYQAVCGNLISL